MKRSNAMRTVMLLLSVVAIGCQESRPALPTAASVFLPNIEGVWSGPMTLLAASGGECVGGVIPSFLPSTDQGTVTLTQNGASLEATMTTESTGLACKYSGTATTSSLAMNATSCDRTGLVVSCIGGQARELRLVGSSIAASWDGNQISGQATTTYNVFTPPQGIQNGVGSLVARHSFTATRR
jgi:hypothetical protein